MNRLFAALWLVAAVIVTMACESPPEACGEYPAGGGPAVIRTRDQELCEITRQRVMQHLQKRTDLDYAMAEDIFEKSQRWQFEDTLPDLIARLERDAGPDFAAAVQRAVESVARSSKPYSAECETERESCLTKGAAKGAYLALTQRADLVRGLQPKTDSSPAGGRAGGIDLEDMSD